jgi:hypothetical protein
MELEKMPALVLEFHVYYALEKSDNLQDVVYLDVIAPDGQAVSQSATMIKWDPNSEGAEQGVALRGVIFRKPARYTVRLRTEGQTLAERHLRVTASAQA